MLQNLKPHTQILLNFGISKNAKEVFIKKECKRSGIHRIQAITELNAIKTQIKEAEKQRLTQKEKAQQREQYDEALSDYSQHPKEEDPPLLPLA